jgi:hypothetical protein
MIFRLRFAKSVALLLIHIPSFGLVRGLFSFMLEVLHAKELGGDSTWQG